MRKKPVGWLISHLMVIWPLNYHCLPKMQNNSYCMNNWEIQNFAPSRAVMRREGDFVCRNIWQCLEVSFGNVWRYL